MATNEVIQQYIPQPVDDLRQKANNEALQLIVIKLITKLNDLETRVKALEDA